MQGAVIILQLVLHTRARWRCLESSESSGYPKVWPCMQLLEEPRSWTSCQASSPCLLITKASTTQPIVIAVGFTLWLCLAITCRHTVSPFQSEAEPQLRPEFTDLMEVTGLAKGFDHGPVDRSRDVPGRSAGTQTPPLDYYCRDYCHGIVQNVRKGCC